MEEKFKIGEKEFVVRELLATDEDEIMDLELDKPSQRIKERIKRSCNMSDDDSDDKGMSLFEMDLGL